MKVTMMRPVEFDAAVLRVTAPVRYDDDLDEYREMLAGTDYIQGRHLMFELDLDTRKVWGWPAGRTCEIHTKVVDTGTYFLVGRDGKTIATRSGYVPGVLPGEHFGDYLILSIGADGTLAGFRPDQRRIAEYFGESE